ncbi:MAG: hypothetical protein WAW41_03830 [Methylobacter sp.]
MNENELDKLKRQIEKINENRRIKKDNVTDSIGYSNEDLGSDRKIIKVQRREEWPEPPKKDK